MSTREYVMSMHDDGNVSLTLQWSSTITAEDVDDMKEWLALIVRAAERLVETTAPCAKEPTA